ncbi:MAG: cytochrome c oxidase subunit 3 [Gammaproteobacteria bacterium]|nr:cytochrome c oxidase subunit 3 [Gammaproteobacteria bacterium]
MVSSHYYVPQAARWPIGLSAGLFILLVGVSIALNGGSIGSILMVAGLAIVLAMVAAWFHEVIGESVRGTYHAAEDNSFRMGMLWFIISEVAFFACFFGALFYLRQLAVPWLGGEGTGFFTNHLLNPDFEAAWPTNGPEQLGGNFQAMGWQGLPIINTLILLSSSVTITIAHHALRAGHRNQLTFWLLATVVLGFAFLFFQVEEYLHAYHDLNLTLESGVYGSTFFMLTGFHGMHVTLGATMLLIIWLRVLKGHFQPNHHFAFEAAAWYWHFVDVVWLFLFIFVYIL